MNKATEDWMSNKRGEQEGVGSEPPRMDMGGGNPGKDPPDNIFLSVEAPFLESHSWPAVLPVE